MNSLSLARDDLRKARARRRALQVLYEEESYDDVVREAQEIVELILKGARRYIGIDPPKRHDVGATLRAHQDHLPDAWRKKLAWIEKVSASLFEERSPAFYGNETDVIPASDLYEREDAERALNWTTELVKLYEHMVTERGQRGDPSQDEEGGENDISETSTR
ncbi:MAG: HEPN domain-containing protein [Acidobacteria bacterium]|nr:MAG: HEPN domain-containing protein [Acidobacteriota bacterium]